MPQYNVKLLGFNSINTAPYVVQCNPTLTETDDSAFFLPTCYAKIFGKTKRFSSRQRKLLSVVRIKGDGPAIYRRYRSSRFVHLPDDDSVGLSALSCSLLLGNDSVENAEVTVSKGCWFGYYWNHPFHATRVSFRLGMPALLISIVSLILSICSVCF